MSSRRPLKAEWRTMPSPVQPAISISATSCGRVQWVPSRLARRAVSANGDFPKMSRRARDFRDAKAMAHGLRNALKSRAVETTHSDCLELIAKAFGYDSWNILAAKIEASRPRAGEKPACSP